MILEGKKRLPDEATVFQAELMAIKMAMFDLGGSFGNEDRYVKLFSDSRSAIQALNSRQFHHNWSKTPLVQLIW